MVVSPTPIYLGTVQGLLSKSDIIVACQNPSATGQGAFTGEIAAEQLTDFGIGWTLIGHSERRSYYGETDEVVTKKVKSALANKLTVKCKK